MQNQMEAMTQLQSQMAAMMTQMQSSINRFAPEEGMPIPNPQHPGHGRTFTTPPHRTSTPLSPIPEVSTPLPTPTHQIPHLSHQIWANSLQRNFLFHRANKVFDKKPQS
jgi:hypothetical protein